MRGMGEKTASDRRRFRCFIFTFLADKTLTSVKIVRSGARAQAGENVFILDKVYAYAKEFPTTK